jgi:hypothetical protein
VYGFGADSMKGTSNRSSYPRTTRNRLRYPTEPGGRFTARSIEKNPYWEEEDALMFVIRIANENDWMPQGVEAAIPLAELGSPQVGAVRVNAEKKDRLVAERDLRSRLQPLYDAYGKASANLSVRSGEDGSHVGEWLALHLQAVPER